MARSRRSHKRSPKRSRKGSRSSRKWSRKRRSAHVLSKRKAKYAAGEWAACAGKRRRVCRSKPNCAWSRGKGCRKRSKLIYMGPSLPM